jgi:7-keto-8-aminopelargonate synthetase-like enzyme
MRYKHLDLADLEAQLISAQSNRLRLIVTDGVFSMDGDVAPLKHICDLADRSVPPGLLAFPAAELCAVVLSP